MAKMQDIKEPKTKSYYVPPTSSAISPAAETKPFKTLSQTMQEQEKDQLNKNYTDYMSKINRTQVTPQQIEGMYNTYKGAQTGTNKTFEDTMGKNLEANNAAWAKAMEKSAEAEKAYSSRVGAQYGLMERSQADLANAASQAQNQAQAERQAGTDFFNNEVKGRFTSAMDKAAQEYAMIKGDVRKKMDATDAYYQNTIKPQYGKLMEGGLSLRDASDPSNYVSKGVQNAYEGLINKSAEDAQRLTQQTKKGGQADYGVLAALGNQARGSTSNLPTTGAQQQVMQQANLNQASQAYQTAMQRVAGIEDQQRLYAQQARQTGLESGMDQSWKNYDAFGRSTQAAQAADVTNFNAMMAGNSTLGNLTSQDAATQFQGTQGLSGARQGLTSANLNAISTGMNAASQGASGIGNLASQISGLAGSEFDNSQQIANLQRAMADNTLKNDMMVPEFKYNTASGFNQSDYATQAQALQQGYGNTRELADLRFTKDNQSLMMGRSDRQANEQAALVKEINDNNLAAQKAVAEAESNSGMWSSILGTAGTIGGGVLGGIYGGPMGAAAGASMGGSVLGGIGGAIGGGGRGFTGQQSYINPYAMASAMGANQGKVTSPSSVPSLNSFWGQSSPQIGVSPTMQSSALSPAALAQSQNQFGLGVDPSLMYSPYSRYGIGAPTFSR
jgi:hypothetical protein